MVQLLVRHRQPGGWGVVEVGQSALLQCLEVCFTEAGFGLSAVGVGRVVHAEWGDFFDLVGPLGWVEPVVAQVVELFGGLGYGCCMAE